MQNSTKQFFGYTSRQSRRFKNALLDAIECATSRVRATFNVPVNLCSICWNRKVGIRIARRLHYRINISLAVYKNIENERSFLSTLSRRNGCVKSALQKCLYVCTYIHLYTTVHPGSIILYNI